jgi:hypothetical protein
VGSSFEGAGATAPYVQSPYTTPSPRSARDAKSPVLRSRPWSGHPMHYLKCTLVTQGEGLKRHSSVNTCPVHYYGRRRFAIDSDCDFLVAMGASVPFLYNLVKLHVDRCSIKFVPRSLSRRPASRLEDEKKNVFETD